MMKTVHPNRRWAEATCSLGLVAVLAGGCGSKPPTIASMNPFSKPAETVAAVPAETDEPSAASRLASVGQTLSGQVSSLGMATSSVWGKTKEGASRVFSQASEAVGGESPSSVAEADPTRLSSPISISPEVFVAQGALYETSGDLTKAMESYRKALEAEPTNGAALTSAARLQMQQQNYAQAVKYLELAISANPNEALLHNDHGLALAKTGDLNGATRALQRAVDLSSGKSRFANNLANIRYDAGDVDGALAILVEHNKPAVAHHNMAYLHFRAGNYAGARTQLMAAIQQEPLVAGDSTAAQAIARSREMLNQLDSSATRIAEAGSGILSVTSQASNAFSTLSGASQATGGIAPMSNAQAAPPQWGLPPAMVTGTTSERSQTPVNPPASGSTQQQPFALPPGAFDQMLR
jgi:tetratricopeptide (TPR) repeat protein